MQLAKIMKPHTLPAYTKGSRRGAVVSATPLRFLGTVCAAARLERRHFFSLAAVSANQTNRAHDRLRRTVVALDTVPEQLDALSGQGFHAAVNAAQGNGRGKSAVDVVEPYDAEIVRTELAGTLQGGDGPA